MFTYLHNTEIPDEVLVELLSEEEEVRTNSSLPSWIYEIYG